MHSRRGLALVLVAAVMLLPVSPSPALVQDGPTESPEPVLWIDREGRKVAVPLEQNGGKTYATVPSGDEMIRVPVDLEWGDEIASVASRNGTASGTVRHAPVQVVRSDGSVEQVQASHSIIATTRKSGDAGSEERTAGAQASSTGTVTAGEPICYLTLLAPNAYWTYYGFGIRSNFTALCTDFGVIFNTVQQYRALLLENESVFVGGTEPIVYGWYMNNSVPSYCYFDDSYTTVWHSTADITYSPPGYVPGFTHMISPAVWRWCHFAN